MTRQEKAEMRTARNPKEKLDKELEEGLANGKEAKNGLKAQQGQEI